MILIQSKYIIYSLRNILRRNSQFVKFIAFLLIIISVSSCEKWYDTKDASHVSQLPRFEITGGEFNFYVVVDSAEFTDPGAKAFEGENELAVYSYGDVDLTEVGVYIIYYYAENSDGLSSVGERIVAVGNYDVTDNDLSGDYEGTLWSPLTEMKVTKVNENGLYKCSEVFGFPGSEVKGRFVDLGENELVLVPGEGDFGRYAMSNGYYTRSTLSWTISLLDEPYEGIDIEVMWQKKDE
jgi:hypothetical protein